MLRLKENPREWQKFVAVMGVVANVPVWYLWRQGRVSLALALAVATITLGALLLALIQPRWFRGFYRGGMRVSYQIGQVIGKVLLTGFFFLLVTPLGLALRLAGKDLLQLKRDDAAATWWHPAKNNRDFDRMF
jgi:hypothetical protein